MSGNPKDGTIQESYEHAIGGPGKFATPQGIQKCLERYIVDPWKKMKALIFAAGQVIDEMSQAFPMFRSRLSRKTCKVVHCKTDVWSGANCQVAEAANNMEVLARILLSSIIVSQSIETRW